MRRTVTVEQKQYRPITIPLIIALANHILTEIRFVERIDEGVFWDRSQWKVSPGRLAKAMVLATFFDMRAPLVHVGERFNGLDTEYLFGEGISSEDINEYNLGQMLDRMSEKGCNGWYRNIALTVGTIYKIIINRLHADTTTISFYGEYDVDLSLFNDGERANMLAIDRGYNKDGRPQCKQMVVGQIVNEDGIVLVSESLDGNTSDIEWNRQAIRFAREIQEDLAQSGVFVADSKLICEDHFRNLMDPEKRVSFVSRCPANFCSKLESRMIQKAYEQETWQDLGSYHEGKSAAVYQGTGYEEVVYGYPTRLLVVRSSALASKAEQQMKQQRMQVEELVKELEKKTFKCLPDVEEEWQRFSHNKNTRLFTCSYETDCQSQEKWPRGRHGPDTKPTGIETSYRIKVSNIAENPETAGLFRQTESCFVVISNAGQDTDDRKLLGIYKGQQVVENSFQLLKSPCLASVIYLKNENRIRALSMLLSLSLLVRSIIQYRMRQGLKTYNEQNPKKPLKAGWGNKKLEAPTFKMLFEYARNNAYVRTGPEALSFDFLSEENQLKVTTLLHLMGLTVASLI